MEFSAGGRSSRRLALAFVLAFFVLASLLLLAAPASTFAQEPAVEAPAEPPATGDPTVRQPNLFWHIVKSAGPVFGLILFLVSVGLVALIVLLSMDLRMAVAIPPSFVEEFTDTVNKRKFREAFELARNDSSFLARVLTAGMGRLQYGIEDAREAAMNTVESIKAGKEQLTTYLSTIGTLGPMLGLVGTVFGMILSFMELSSGGTPKPAKLAEGISHALVVTLLGIAISVPAIFFYAFFKNRLIRITMDVATIADDLLTQMYHNSRRPAQPGTDSRAVTAPTTTATKQAEA
jgi:biopolymer transport protein ExbB